VNGHLWNKYTWAGSPQFCEPCAVSVGEKRCGWWWNLHCKSSLFTVKVTQVISR